MSNFFYTDHADPAQIARLNQEILAKPEVQKALSDWSKRYGSQAGYSGTRANQNAIGELQRVLRAAGLPNNMRLQMGANGQPAIVDNGGFEWGNIVATGIGAGVGGYTLAGAGGAPAAAGSTGGSAAAGTSAGLGGAAGASGAASAGAGAGGGLGTMGWLTLGSMGANAASQWYQQRQADRAAGRELDMSQQALELEREMFDKEQERQRQQDEEDKRRYEQNRGDDLRRDEERAAAFAPYGRLGRGALSRLAQGMGLRNDPSNMSAPLTGPIGAPVTPGARTSTGTPGAPSMPGSTPTSGSLMTLGMGQPTAANQSQGGMVTIHTPQGTHVLVPFGRVNEALAQGGQRV